MIKQLRFMAYTDDPEEGFHLIGSYDFTVDTDENYIESAFDRVELEVKQHYIDNGYQVVSVEWRRSSFSDDYIHIEYTNPDDYDDDYDIPMSDDVFVETFYLKKISLVSTVKSASSYTLYHVVGYSDAEFLTVIVSSAREAEEEFESWLRNEYYKDYEEVTIRKSPGKYSVSFGNTVGNLAVDNWAYCLSTTKELYSV